jgi:hypothetical protein
MWQRYNQTSHIFEKSTDNGASWQPLPLNASIISEGNLDPNRDWVTTAYTDVHNTFTEINTFNAGIILPGYPIPIGQWTDYTPSILATSAPFALGNGTLSGHYAQIDKTIFLDLQLTAGTTTNFGTGNLRFGLPKHNIAAYIGGAGPSFHGRIFNPATGQSFVCYGSIDSVDHINLWEANSGYPLHASNPFGLGNGVSINASGFYQTL